MVILKDSYQNFQLENQMNVGLGLLIVMMEVMDVFILVERQS